MADDFVDALAFNWVIAGTDAHAKNYSVLLNGAQVRLAPLYDVASSLPYDDMYQPKLKMAMRIGGEYTISKIERRHWARFASSIGFDPDRLVQRIDRIAANAADAFAEVARTEAVRAVRSELPERLVTEVAAHAQRCRDALAGT
jgi:serine/threonine-protein kinase HipA